MTTFEGTVQAPSENYQPYAWPRTDKHAHVEAVRVHKSTQAEARSRRRTASAGRVRQQTKAGLRKSGRVAAKWSFGVFVTLYYIAEFANVFVTYMSGSR